MKMLTAGYKLLKYTIGLPAPISRIILNWITREVADGLNFTKEDVKNIPVRLGAVGWLVAYLAASFILAILIPIHPEQSNFITCTIVMGYMVILMGSIFIFQDVLSYVRKILTQ